MPKGKDKRLVYIPGDIVKEVKEISRRRGESLNLYVSEVLRLAIKANRLGYSPSEAAEFLDIMQAQRNLGGAFIPTDVLSYLNNKASDTEIEQLQKKWFESGKWHGKYLNEKFKEPIEAFKKFLEATRWDLNEVEINKTEKVVKFRCISTLLTGEGTKLLVKFIEGAMMSIGYEIEKSDAIKGMMLLEFKK
jgi:hypothetical protein